MKLKLNGRDVDLKKALPLTLGDMEEIQGLGLIDSEGQMNVAGPKALIDLLHYIAHKADDSVTRDNVREVSVREMRAISEWAQKELMEQPDADRPS